VLSTTGGPNAKLYRNRKGYFSINVQAVCDSDQSYEMHHKIVSGRIPTGLFESCSKLPFNQLLIRAANKLLDTVWGMQSNMATQQNRYPILPAPIHFLRMTPVLGYGGLISIFVFPRYRIFQHFHYCICI
jgi:hypothetical protein